jgi:hypothetical protein
VADSLDVIAGLPMRSPFPCRCRRERAARAERQFDRADNSRYGSTGTREIIATSGAID